MAEKQYKADCPRCLGGKGRIDAFSHVLGGVCFKCNGKGYVMLKSKPQRSVSWRAGATVIRQDGPNDHPVGTVVYPIFTLKARNEKQALQKVKTQLERSKGYDAASAFVKPV